MHSAVFDVSQSVCPSVMLQYCVRTVKHIVEILLSSDALIILFLPRDAL